MVLDRLEALRAEMKKQNVQAVILPTSDYHDTEYVAPYFQARAWFSGFTGSAGILVVTLDGGALWTDGRYFVQAEKQLQGSGLTLMKMGEKKTPAIPQYLIENLEEGSRVAWDGRTANGKDFKRYQKELEAKGITLVSDLDFPALAWKDRPAMPASQTFLYDESYAGESSKDKLARLRKAMKLKNAQAHVTGKIDEIAWLLNMRAHDIPCFPAFLSYLIVEDDGGTLYINAERLDEESAKALKENGIAVKDYDAIYEDLPKLEKSVLLQEDLLNAALCQSIQNPVYGDDPIVLMKAVKNETEQQGAREAHIRDGAAVVKFWKWLEENVPSKTVTEEDAVKVLHDFRAEQDKFLEDSFETISAYGANAAMPHYHSDPNNPVIIEPKGLYLVDSGGQYMDGTTDITRTFVVGDLDDFERLIFTAVLQGHIALASTKFLYGCKGSNLDILARKPLWDKGLDYKHGTGHGIGHLLNVHEAPNGIRWNEVPERNDRAVLEEGMITSDEPGYYEPGKFGVRHENLMLTRKAEQNGYGQFMEHETLTMVPFDVRGLDLSMMTKDEIKWLNDYHAMVEEKLQPLLSEEEFAWLQEKTKPVA